MKSTALDHRIELTEITVPRMSTDRCHTYVPHPNRALLRLDGFVILTADWCPRFAPFGGANLGITATGRANRGTCVLLRPMLGPD